MRYICLVYTDPRVFEQLSQEEHDDLDEASLADNAELEASGHLIVVQALESVDAAVTIRQRGGRMSATNGPFAETTEQLGGFVCVEARDLNEATTLAARLPIARYATIEVRPIMDVAARVRERKAR
jgi:hypothetical protein